MSSDDPPTDNNEPPGGPSKVDLESLSLAYSEQLSMGGVANVEQILAQVPKEQRAAFLKRLNSMAAGYATPGGKDDISKQSDTFSQAAEQSFVDSASMTATGAAVSGGVKKSDATKKQLGHYTLEGEIGRGGMGVVYRARHVDRGDIVALKILPAVDGESLHRFKREFRSLADISHPNLVGLRSLESAGDQWFFTMDLIEDARSFRSWVRPSGEVHATRLRNAVLQLCDGISKLHELNILHRDLKPSNVVVAPDGRLVILDFGLVSELKRNDQTLSIQSVSGTPAYMSPEAAASEQESYASDWYSFGVMLYQAICGKLPFDGEPLQILADKRSHDAPRLESANTSLEDLIPMCMALLSRDASARPGYEQIRSVVGDTKIASAAGSLAEEVLLGRDWHLSTLRSAFESVIHRNAPSIVFVSGKSGEGKSALVDGFLNRLRADSECTILAGRCYDRESVPFKALDSLIDALAAHLRRLDSLDARRTASYLPDDTGILARVFPVMMRVEAIAERPAPNLVGLDEKQVRKRAFGALKELLRRLSQQVALVLFCDDLQWGDADSAEALMDMLSGDDVPRLLFVGSYRSDESETSPFLRSWSSEQQSRKAHCEITSVEVSPLRTEDCLALLISRFPELPAKRADQLISELYLETGGNAFLVNRLLDGLRMSGNRMRHVQLKEVISHKLAELPAEAAELLKTVAVSGQSVEMEELLAVAGQRASTYSTLTAMRNLRLIRFLDEELDGRVDTYHDKIRETLLAALGSDESRSRHQKLGEAIESRSKEIDDSVIRRIVAGEEIAHPDVERIYDLSFHFHAAAVTEKAGLYAFLAAEQARRQFSPEVAVRQYELAQEEVTSGALRKQLPRFTIGLAEGYCWRGQFAKSAALLEDTSVENFSDHQRAHLLSIACENAFALNQPKKALDLCYEALRVLGVTTPTSPMLNLLLTGRRLTWHLIRLGRSSHGKLEASNIDRLRVKLFEQGLRVSMFRSGTDLFWFLLEGVRAAERFSAMGELAQFYGMYATAASAIGLQSHADRYLNKAIQISEDSGDLYSSGQALQFSGQSHFAQGKYTTAIETLSTANNVFEAVGGSWFNHLVLLHRDQSRFMLGSIHQAAVENWTTFQSSVRQNDMRTNCTAYLQCRVTDGMFPLEKVENRIVRQAEDILSTCNFDKAWGIRHLYKNEYDEAIACFERALERPYKARIPNWHVVVGLLFLTQALRLSAEDLQESNPTEAKKRRRRALKIGRRGSWICRFFPTEYSFALREYGEVLIDLGKYRKAEKYLLKSCAVSKKYDTPYELAKSKLALARLAVKRDESDASNQLASARAEVEKYRDQMKNALAEIEDQF